MTGLVPELAALPVFATLDGELCAFGLDSTPDFPLICERMLMRRSGIPVTYMVFDLLSLDGQDFTGAPYSERRAQLEHSTSTGSIGRHRRRSTTGNCYLRRSASTSSKEL